ncbi:MAG: transcriptional regulator [Treponema sp.]|jgi:SAM-dependent methyltransferase|nr:transcriptional regulator [Treponema sp.]
MSDMHQIQQASDDFSRARGRALLHRLRHFMNMDRDRLLSLNDVKEILKPKNETYRGMQTVPINLIVGSEGRYRDFNKYFLPRSEHLRQRWERVDIARLKNIILPPIQLYEIGGVYFVRDGNHRVSVAHSQGVEIIDAEVISLSSEIPISPSMTQDELRIALIKYEKKIFYEKTGFLRLTDCADLDFSSAGRYDVIYNHILVHKYYMNEQAAGEIPFSDALVSWYNQVYKPIIAIIQEERLYLHFPGRTSGDLYVWIVTHWDFLKKKYGLGFSLREAARDFSEKYGVARKGPLAFLARLINKKGEG